MYCFSDVARVVRNRWFFLPHLYLAPPLGRPHWNFTRCFDMGKPESLGYSAVFTAWWFVSRYSTTPACVGRTDRQTDEWIAISVLHCASYLCFAESLCVINVHEVKVSFGQTWQLIRFIHDFNPFVIFLEIMNVGVSLLRPREQLRSIVMSASVCLSCLSVCLYNRISP